MKKSPIDIIITAGPTREKIDPVRFISNFSTGIMGFEIAREAAKRGHNVVLISGACGVKAPANVPMVSAESALDMYKAVKKAISKGSCLIMAAAVSDYKPAEPLLEKLKKKKKTKITFTETIDILKSLKGRNDIYKIGFALESHNLRKKALAKLKDKNLDVIVGNAISGVYSPFGGGRKDFITIDKNGKVENFKSKSKKEMAKIIIKTAEKAFYG